VAGEGGRVRIIMAGVFYEFVRHTRTNGTEMKRLFAILLVATLLAAGCGQPTQTYTLEGLTADDVSKVVEIALSSESFTAYKAEFKESWVGEVYTIDSLVWVELGTDTGKEMWPAVQIYFGEDIELRGGMEVLLLVDLDAREVVEAFDKPLKSLPSRS